jgi:hypothetical protein
MQAERGGWCGCDVEGKRCLAFEYLPLPSRSCPTRELRGLERHCRAAWGCVLMCWPEMLPVLQAVQIPRYRVPKSCSTADSIANPAAEWAHESPSALYFVVLCSSYPVPASADFSGGDCMQCTLSHWYMGCTFCELLSHRVIEGVDCELCGSGTQCGLVGRSTSTVLSLAIP